MILTHTQRLRFFCLDLCMNYTSRVWLVFYHNYNRFSHSILVPWYFLYLSKVYYSAHI